MAIETNPLDEARAPEEVARQEASVEASNGAVTPASQPSLSHARLARPVHVVTAEHLGWYAIAIWAVATRLMALGARPLDAGSARTALLEVSMMKHGMPAMFEHPGIHASWPEIAQAWIFTTLGASDLTSRLVLAGCGLVLVAGAASMRRYLGRAGAMGFAGLIAVSPSITYYSRGGSNVICVMALMVVSIALAVSMRRRLFPARAFVLGCTIAMFITADPIGYAVAATMIIALAFIGLFDLLTTDHRRLRFRIWWQQRRVIVLTAAFVAIFGWFWLATGLMTYPLSVALPRDLHAAFITHPGKFEHDLWMLAPIFGFYEFALVLMAIVGMVAVVTRGVVGGVARLSIIWAIVSVGLFLTVGASGPEVIVAMIVPLAMLAGCGIEWMHQSRRWEALRVPIAFVVALTVYIQVMTSFVFATPNVSEKPWDRHALLFWQAPATSKQTRIECARAARSVTAEASSAMIPVEAPQVRWYLRKFALADNRDVANIIVSIPDKTSSSAVGNASPAQFGFEESWTPAYEKMRAMDAIQYLFTQRVWNEVEIRDLELIVARPGEPPAATVILAPESVSSPAQATPTPTPR